MSPDRKRYSRFPATSWSAIGRAIGPDAPAARAAFEALLAAYVPVLRGYLVRVRRVPAAIADDLVQGFVADKILRDGLFERADRERGRFRSLLLKALHHYVADQARREGRQPLPVGDPGDLPQASVGATQNAAFEREWARAVLDAALADMRAECTGSGRTEVWDIFACRVVQPALDDAPPPSYEALVRRFGIESPRRASNLLVTGKRMFQRHLERAVQRFAGFTGPSDAELCQFRAILLDSRAR